MRNLGIKWICYWFKNKFSSKKKLQSKLNTRRRWANLWMKIPCIEGIKMPSIEAKTYQWKWISIMKNKLIYWKSKMRFYRKKTNDYRKYVISMLMKPNRYQNWNNKFWNYQHRRERSKFAKILIWAIQKAKTRFFLIISDAEPWFVKNIL